MCPIIWYRQSVLSKSLIIPSSPYPVIFRVLYKNLDGVWSNLSGSTRIASFQPPSALCSEPFNCNEAPTRYFKIIMPHVILILALIYNIQNTITTGHPICKRSCTSVRLFPRSRLRVFIDVNVLHILYCIFFVIFIDWK
jgi:hypothetical protein